MEMLNRWQLFWRSADEARIIPRLMVIATFVALIVYVFLGTKHYHAIVNGALVQSAAGAATFGELTPVLAAVTAFYGITIPMLSRLFLDMWRDYRQSGIDWQNIEARAMVNIDEFEDRS